MRKEKSWTQKQYETAYVWMRRGIDVEYMLSTGNLPREAILAADYSYQATNHNLHGWNSNLRHSRFCQIKWRILSRRYEPENNPPPIQIDIDRW